MIFPVKIRKGDPFLKNGSKAVFVFDRNL